MGPIRWNSSKISGNWWVLHESWINFRNSVKSFCGFDFENILIQLLIQLAIGSNFWTKLNFWKFFFGVVARTLRKLQRSLMFGLMNESRILSWMKFTWKLSFMKKLHESFKKLHESFEKVFRRTSKSIKTFLEKLRRFDKDLMWTFQATFLCRFSINSSALQCQITNSTSSRKLAPLDPLLYPFETP